MKIAVIGGGNMGGALVEGFLQSGKYAASDLFVGDRSEMVRNKFAARGVNVFADNREAASQGDIVVVAVKPYLVAGVAAEIKGCIAEGARVVSIAAGVDINAVEECFGDGIACFRAIPNIAAALCASMTFVSCSKRREDAAGPVLAMFGNVGKAVLLEEKLLDAAMVSASCGMAYALRYIRAAMEASIEMGLTAPISEVIVAQTVRGASELLLAGSEHPEILIDKVSTPGGITIVGLNEMEPKGFTSAVIAGHIAAYGRVKNK